MKSQILVNPIIKSSKNRFNQNKNLKTIRNPEMDLSSQMRLLGEKLMKFHAMDVRTKMNMDLIDLKDEEKY